MLAKEFGLLGGGFLIKLYLSFTSNKTACCMAKQLAAFTVFSLSIHSAVSFTPLTVFVIVTHSHEHMHIFSLSGCVFSKSVGETHKLNDYRSACASFISIEAKLVK